MARLVSKQPFEEIPVDFDFGPRLAQLKAGLEAEGKTLSIVSVQSITADPSGDPDDLDFGSALNWAIEDLAVQPLVKGGRDGVRYHSTCRAIFTDGASSWRFELDGVIYVAEI